MRPRLVEMTPQVYAETVLPHTRALWGGRRTLKTYVANTTELARTAYGKRHYRTIAFRNDDGMLASFKWYEREARVGAKRLQAMGIGAVFTPPELRGRGYASAMLASALDRARSEGFDFAYLFSDIHPQFYKAIGFAEVPSRSISIRSDALPAARINAEPLSDHDWTALRRTFDATEVRRTWGFERPPSFWSWIRAMLGQSAERAASQPVRLVARRGRGIAAYVIGRREPKHDAYVVDEYGFADEAGRELVAPLLRCAAGDLRRIAGWLPPETARDVLPRGSVRRRTDAIWMLAPLTRQGTSFLERAKQSGSSDGVWSTDHV